MMPCGVRFCIFISLLWCVSMSTVLQALEPAKVLHFPIERRSGPFSAGIIANRTFLYAQLDAVTARFNLTRREIRGNRLVRKAKNMEGSEGALMGLSQVGRSGGWFVKFRFGQPHQTVQVDLDLLTSDFFLFTTTSRRGSQFWDFHSNSYCSWTLF